VNTRSIKRLIITVAIIGFLLGFAVPTIYTTIAYIRGEKLSIHAVDWTLSAYMGNCSAHLLIQTDGYIPQDKVIISPFARGIPLMLNLMVPYPRATDKQGRVDLIMEQRNCKDIRTWICPVIKKGKNAKVWVEGWKKDMRFIRSNTLKDDIYRVPVYLLNIDEGNNGTRYKVANSMYEFCEVKNNE